MPKNSTLESNYPNKSKYNRMKNQELLSPDSQSIQNLLAYSKALMVLKRPFTKGKRQTTFRIILN